MKKEQLTLTALSSLALFAQSTQVAFAQITNPAVTGTLGTDATAAADGSLFAEFFIRAWQSITAVGALAVVIYLIWGAFDWISAGGDSGKIEKARNKITQSIIGLILLVASYAIIGMISALFFGEDFNILNPQF